VAPLYASVLGLTSAGASSACVVALAIICLLQYLAHVNRLNRVRREMAGVKAEHELVRYELAGVADELQDMKRDRTMTRFEAQVLREFVAQDDGDKAVRMFLRRFAPNPDEGFAAFLRHEGGRLCVAQSQGLLDGETASFALDKRLLPPLLRGEAIALSQHEVRYCGMWESFSPRDRRKIQRLHLVGTGSTDSLPEVLMTTSLVPAGLEESRQIELAARLLSSIAFSLRDKRALQSHQDELRTTGEKLALRGVVDGKFASPAQMLEEFLRQAAQKSGADRAALYLYSADAVPPLKAFVRCGATLPVGARDQWRRHEDELAQVSLASRGPRHYSPIELARIGIATLVGAAQVVPVMQKNRLLGLVCFSRRHRQMFSDVEQSLAAWAGSHLADLIPRAVSLAEVERKARLDGLTQLANRGEFDRYIEQQISAAARQAAPLSLLMFDLDRFKSINDSCGHRGGDAVLRAVADVIRDCMGAIRSADREKGVRPFVARYGGEELAVVVQLEELAARRIGEFIRTRLEMQAIEFEGQTIHVTTSGGLATFPDHADTAEQLIAAADAALYQAKANGRNRIEVAAPTLVDN
jgi:diguanylate cyclase (GGDEF)-like protein